MTSDAIRTRPRRSAPDLLAHGAWLLLGAGLTAFTIGDTMAPAAGWLAPVFMLRFLRRTPPWGLALGAAAFAVAQAVGWRGALPFHGATYYAVTCAVGLLFFLPYVADRLLSPRLPPLAASLVLPAAWVTLEFAYGHAGLGTWGLACYAQFGELPLMQLVSVTGLWGLTFLIGWTATIANALWQGQGRVPSLRAGAVAAAATLAAVLVAGGLRLAFNPPAGPTVRIAGITVDNMAVFKGTWRPLTYGKPLTPAMAEAAAPAARRLQRDLLQRTEEEALAGAKIVVWSEGNALVFKADEAAFVREGQSLAAQRRIYLIMAMATMTPGAPRVENKLVVIDPDGAVRGVYRKAHPTPGEMSVPGEGRMGVLQTPYGRLGWAICYDYDYPDLVRQAGRAGVDILINPAWESRGMSPLHTQMAVFRGIETGATLFRVANGGLNLATDHLGRVVAAVDPYAASGPAVVFRAEAPLKGGPTLYSRIGDAFAWASVALLAALCAWPLRMTWRAARSPDRPGESRDPSGARTRMPATEIDRSRARS